MNVRLEQSYALCRRTARRSASSFYFTFFLLPPAQREAMCALYAFLRHTDDLSDASQPADHRSLALACWRRSLDRALGGQFDSPLLPALVDTVRRFGIRLEHLHTVIDGVEMDLTTRQYETFEELERYCHCVASCVGLACIEVWGYRGPGAVEPARRCGVAFQLTNILRDLKEDFDGGRVYVPAEDLRRFDCSPEDFTRLVRSERMRALVQFEIERARRFYDDSRDLSGWLSHDGQRIFGAMHAAYRQLLDEIERRNNGFVQRRVRLSGWRKLRIALRALRAASL